MTDRLPLSLSTALFVCLVFVGFTSGDEGGKAPKQSVKRLPCSTCSSTGGFQCDLCAGVGKTRNPCPRCVSDRSGKSLGKIDCTPCDKGRRKCRTCKGKGHKYVTRLTVDGRKVSKRLACGSCSSRGSRECRSCDAGYRNCPKCKTARFLEARCALCRGKKTFECYACEGQGTIEAVPISVTTVDSLGALKAQAGRLYRRVEACSEKYWALVRQTATLLEETSSVRRFLEKMSDSLGSTSGWPDDLKEFESDLHKGWKKHGRAHKRHMRVLDRLEKFFDKKLQGLRGLRELSIWVDKVLHEYHSETEDELLELLEDRQKEISDYEEDVPRLIEEIDDLETEREALIDGLAAARAFGRQLRIEVGQYRDGVLKEEAQRRRIASLYESFEKQAASILADLPLPKSMTFKRIEADTGVMESLEVEARYTARSRPETTGPALDTFVCRIFGENEDLEVLRLTVRSVLVQPDLRGERDTVTLDLTRHDVLGGAAPASTSRLFVQPSLSQTSEAEVSTARVLLLYVAPGVMVLLAAIVISLFFRSRRSDRESFEFD